MSFGSIARRWLHLAVAAVLMAAMSTAHAAQEDWPRFWRERADAPTQAILDRAFDTYSKNPYPGDSANYEQAVVALRLLLGNDTLPSIDTLGAEQRLRVGRASMFLAELLAARWKYQEAAASAQTALTLIESAVPVENAEVADFLGRFARLQAATGKHTEALALYQRSLAIRVKAPGPRHLEAASDLKKIAATYRALGRHAEALPPLRQALSIQEQVLPAGHRDIAVSLEDLARVYLYLEQEAEALPLFQRSFAIRTKTDDPLAVASDMDFVARDFNIKPSSALTLYQKSLAIREAVLGANHKDVAWSLARLAHAHSQLGRYEQALGIYQRGAVVMEAALDPDHPEVASALSFVAETYQKLGRYSEALPILQRVVAIREKNPARPQDVAHALQSLGRLYHYSLNQYTEAEPLYRRALEIREAPGQPRFLLAEGLGDLARLYDTTDRYPEALPLYQRAISISDESSDPGVAFFLGDLAMMHLALGEPAKSLPLAQRALAASESVGTEHLGIASSLEVLANVYDSMGEHARALSLMQKSLGIWERVLGPEHPSVAISLRKTAQLHCSLDQYAPATSLLHRAERIAIEHGVPESTWRIQSALFLCYALQGQSELALLWGKQAVNTIQGLRAGMAGMEHDLQRSFLQDKRSAYTDLAAILIRESRLPEAQRIMAMLKEEEYFDFVRRDATADPRSTYVPLTGAERVVHQRYYAIRNELSRLAAEYDTLQNKRKLEELTAQENARSKVLAADLIKARAAFDAFVGGLSKLLASDPEHAQSVRALQQQIQTHRTLLGTLGDAKQGVATLQYIASEQRLHIILTTPSVQLAREVTIERSVLNGKIASFRQSVQNPRIDARALGRELHGLLIAPLGTDLEAQGVHTLILFLDGALRYVPFAALVQDDDSYLIERYRLAIHTEAARSAFAQRPQAQWKVAALGVTRGFPEQNFSALPAVRSELDGIVRPGVLPGQIYLDERFNLGNFEASLGNPVLHVASHFRFLPGSDSSFLLLGDGSSLTLHDISRRDLRFDAVDLLTLSACETAVGGGRDANGLEVEGLGVLAQIQGAKAVLATLWAVADTSTGELMQHFYRLRQGQKLTKAEALRQAQLALLRGDTEDAANTVAAAPDMNRGAPLPQARATQPNFVPSSAAPFSHPFYWAPFILMGNWL